MIASGPPEIEVRRSAERFHTVTSTSESWHSFSFGSHHNAANMRHGDLIAHNEESLLPGAGFAEHTHREVEIVTWVLSGALIHSDDLGQSHTVRPGQIQRLSAGTGIRHSEHASADAPVRFVQMWIAPDVRGGLPSYARGDVDPARLADQLTPVASGWPEHAAITPVGLRNRGAALLVGRFGTGSTERIPSAPHMHLFVTRGTVEIEPVGVLRTGDAARLVNGGELTTRTREPAELLAWLMR